MSITGWQTWHIQYVYSVYSVLSGVEASRVVNFNCKQFDCQISSEIQAWFTVTGVIGCGDWSAASLWLKALEQCLNKPHRKLDKIPPAHVCWVTNLCSDVRGVFGSWGAGAPFPVWLNVKPDCIEDKGDRRAHSERTGSLSRWYFKLLKRWGVEFV